MSKRAIILLFIVIGGLFLSYYSLVWKLFFVEGSNVVITVSVDSENINNLEDFLSILTESNIKYVVSFYPNFQNIVDKDEYLIIKKLLDNASEVISSTYSYVPLTRLPDEIIRVEILSSNIWFNEHYRDKYNPHVLYLPWGEYSSSIIPILRDTNISVTISYTDAYEKCKVYTDNDLFIILGLKLNGLSPDVVLNILKNNKVTVFIISCNEISSLEDINLLREIIDDITKLEKKGVIRLSTFSELTTDLGNIAEKRRSISIERLIPIDMGLIDDFQGNLSLANYYLKRLRLKDYELYANCSHIVSSLIDTTLFYSDHSISEREMLSYKMYQRMYLLQFMDIIRFLSKMLLSTVKSWIYILQADNVSYNDLVNLPVDLLVIDPDDFNLTYEEISKLKERGKIVLAYLSIGEAEDYRDYWCADWRPGEYPEWLGPENSEWSGCYPVKYWYIDWKGIIASRLREIIEIGYDGVYLDRIDVYWYWAEEGYQYDFLTFEMVKFISEISTYARKMKPGFLIMPQNGIELLENPKFISIIDGIGKEDTWFMDDKPRSAEEVQHDLYYLNIAKRNHIIVLVIDYPREIENIRVFFDKAYSYEFIPYVGTRELNRIGYYEKP